jgi:putative salt-induced outer membrane protein
LFGLLINEAFKTVPVLIVLAGGVLASLNAAADDTVFTVMDDPSTAKKPFEGSVNGGYLPSLAIPQVLL